MSTNTKDMTYDELCALSADEKFEIATRRISICFPSFLQFYALLQRKAVVQDGVTIRLNMKESTSALLEYNPNWIQALHPTTLTVLCCIEVLRLLLHHCTTRKMNPIKVCWEASNVTCSPFTVTKLLNELNSVTNRKKGSSAVRLNDLFPSIDTFAELMPKDFDRDKDMFLEKIFKILNKDEEKFNQAMENHFGPMQQEGEDGGNNGNGSNTPSSEEEALKQHFNSSAQSQTDGWGENEIVDQQVAAAVNKCDTSTWSNLPGGLGQQIITANQRVVDPRVALRRFTTSVFSDFMTQTRMKFPRRYGDEWIGVMQGNRHEQKASVLIAIDCSGSMPDSEVEKACMVVNDFVKHAEVHYCFWDGACGPIQETKRTKNKYDLSGRGCTNPQCVIDKITEEKRHYDGIVYITDCQFCWEKPKLKTNIFIIQSANADPIPDWCKYSMTMKDVHTICGDND